MLERKIGVARNNPERSAQIPAERKARIESESTVDQRDRYVEFLATNPEYESGYRKDFRIFGCRLQRAARESDRQTTVHFAIARVLEFMMAKGGQREGRTVLGVPLDCWPKEIERPVDPVSFIRA